MLVELRVTSLGVIEDQTVLLGPGLTALTGETGAGKTLLIDAISLLTGAPADPTLVAPGAAEGRVEGRFETGDGAEIVLTRVIPARGRSRGYVDGRMASLSQLAEIGARVVDIHGQHAHQSLLSPAAQRTALDQAGGIDTSPVEGARRVVRELHKARAELGGDPHRRARQLDLLSYQLAEIDSANLADADEDRVLMEQEEILADAVGLVEAARTSWELLAGDDGVIDRLGTTVSTTAGRRPLAELHERLLAVQEAVSEVAADARRMAESVEEDPEGLARIGGRRQVLTELRRKYGGTLTEVIAYREDLRRQVEELTSHDRRSLEVEARLEQAHRELDAALERVRSARLEAAGPLSRSVEEHLRALAMPRARFDIEVGLDPATEEVTWLLAANPGQPLLPLAKVASGGELSRAMLATRLVMRPSGGTGTGEGPDTLIFDEVDAGIGGEAAIAVGRALAAVGRAHQVLVVTHLAQVAAFATSHLTVAKEILADRTVATTRPVEGDQRVVELARMLSGRPDSESARRHAEELLDAAGASDPSPNAPRRRR